MSSLRSVDEKRKQKNQEKNTLHPAFGNSLQPWPAFFSGLRAGNNKHLRFNRKL